MQREIVRTVDDRERKGKESLLQGISAGRGQKEELIWDSGGFKKKVKLKGWTR